MSEGDNGSLSPQQRLCPTITHIESVPNLSTTKSSSIVAHRKSNRGDVAELLFPDAENMAEVVGVGLEWVNVL